MTLDMPTLVSILSWAGSLAGLVWYLSRQFAALRESIIRIEGTLSGHDARMEGLGRASEANVAAHAEIGRRLEDAGTRVTRLEERGAR